MSDRLFTVHVIFPRTAPRALAELARRTADRPAKEPTGEKFTAMRETLASLRVLLPDAVAGAWTWTPDGAGAAFDAWCARAAEPAAPPPPGEPAFAEFGLALLVAADTSAARLLEALASTSAPLPPKRATYDRILRELRKVAPAVIRGDAWVFRPRDADAPGIAASSLPPGVVQLLP